MKKYFLLFGGIIVISSIVLMFSCFNNDKVIIESTRGSNLKVNYNALTMMYETEADSGEYKVSSDSLWPLEGYTFNAELSRCENGSKLTWDDENKKVVMQANTSDKCYIYFDKFEYKLGEYLLANPTNGLDINNVKGNMYRFVGKNVDNYLKLGDVLYRIIGIVSENDNSAALSEFQVKVVKADSVGRQARNAWSGAYNSFHLTSLFKYLQSNEVLENDSVIPTIYQNKISEIFWYYGFVSNVYTSNANLILDYEKVDISPITFKVGLIHLSDYFLAEYEEKNCYEDKCDNWLSYGKDEHIMTEQYRDLDYGGSTYWYINDDGTVLFSSSSLEHEVRPVFYLENDIMYVSGKGTVEDPIVIK